MTTENNPAKAADQNIVQPELDTALNTSLVADVPVPEEDTEDLPWDLAPEATETIETAEAVEIVPGETEPVDGSMDEESSGGVHHTPVTALAVQPEQTKSLMSSEDAMAHAAIAIAGGLGGSQNQYEAAMKIMRGHELGIPPAAAVENIYVVNNKTSMGAGLIGAIIKKSGQYQYRVTEHDNDHCQIEFYEKDFLSQGEWMNVGVSWFSIDDAKTAGLVKPKSPWLTYPRNMLLARALTNGARWYCPDVFHGSIYTPEELDSVAVAPPVAAQQGISGAPAPQRAAPATQSIPSANQGSPSASGYRVHPSHPAVDSSELEYDRPPWADGVSWETEECPIHFNHPGSLAAAEYKNVSKPVNFFKGGRMRDHAHNTGSDWCNRANVIADLKAKVESYSAGNDEKFNDFIDTQFSDIAVVDPKDWRAGDWYAILQVLENSALKPSVAGDTGEELPV